MDLLLGTLDVDGTELLQPWRLWERVCEREWVCVRGWRVGDGQRDTPLGPTGAAGARHALQAGCGGGARAVRLQGPFQTILLK